MWGECSMDCTACRCMTANDRWQSGVQLLPQQLDIGGWSATADEVALCLGAALLAKLGKLLECLHPLRGGRDTEDSSPSTVIERTTTAALLATSESAPSACL